MCPEIRKEALLELQNSLIVRRTGRISELKSFIMSSPHECVGESNARSVRNKIN